MRNIPNAQNQRKENQPTNVLTGLTDLEKDMHERKAPDNRLRHDYDVNVNELQTEEK